MTFKFKKNKLALLMFIESLLDVTTIFIIGFTVFLFILGDFSLRITKVSGFVLAYLVLIRLLYRPLTILKNYRSKYLCYNLLDDRVIIYLNEQQDGQGEKFEILLKHVVSKCKNKRFYVFNLNREKSNGIKHLKIPIIKIKDENCYDEWFDNVKIENVLEVKNQEMIESEQLEETIIVDENSNDVYNKVIFNQSAKWFIKNSMALRYTKFRFQVLFIAMSSFCLIMFSIEEYGMAMILLIAIALQFLAPYINYLFMKKGMAKEQSLYLVDDRLVLDNNQLVYNFPIKEMVYYIKNDTFIIEHQSVKKKMMMIDQKSIIDGHMEDITNHLVKIEPNIYRTIVSTISLWVAIASFLFIPGILVWEKYFSIELGLLLMGILFSLSICLDIIQKIYYKKIVKETVSSIVLKVLTLLIVLLMIVSA